MCQDHWSWLAEIQELVNRHLLLQVCQKLSAMNKKVLYISGEESLKQIKLRANRMGEFSENLYLLCETSLNLIQTAIEREKPDVVVIDSIQTM